MASDKFFTLPADVLADKRLGFIDWRTFAAVSYRDRRSIAKGHSRGCYASQRTLAKDINADYRNVGRSLKKLVELGFLRIEDNEDRAGSNEYRVIESGESRNPGSGARSDPGPKIDETRDEESIDPGSGVPSLPKAGRADTPEDYAQFYPQDNLAEAVARGRAGDPKEERNLTAIDTSSLSAGEIAVMVTDTCLDAISASMLARRAGVRPQHVAAAKQGNPITLSSAQLLAAECIRIQDELETTGKIAPMPTLPARLRCHLPDGFDKRVRANQLQFLKTAINNAERAGALSSANRSATTSWLEWIADRSGCESVLADAQRLRLKLSHCDDKAPAQPDPPELTQPDMLDAGPDGLGMGEHVAAAPPSPPPSFFAVLPHDWQQLDGTALVPLIEQAFDRIDREPAAIPDAERIELRELLRGYASIANTDRPTRAKAAILTAELSSRERTTHAQH